MPCYYKRLIENDISKKLKQSMLSTLSSRGKNGLEEIVDNFCCIFRCALDSSREERFKAYKLAGSMNFGFDEEVRSLLIQKLVLYNDVTDGQSDLEKSLVAMNSMMSMHASDQWLYYSKTTPDSDEEFESTSSLTEEGFESSESDDDNLLRTDTIVCFSEADINQLADLWSSTSNERILILFAKLIDMLSQYKKYPSLILSSNVFMKSCTDLRRYLILQHEVLDEWFRIKIFKSVISKEPNFLSVMFKSASYLINCWRLLNTADMTVEMLWIEKCLTNLTNLFYWHINRICLREDYESVAMEITRFFRCLTYAIVKTHSATSHHIRELLWNHLFLQAVVHDRDAMRDVVTLLLHKSELNDVNERHVDSPSSKSKYLIKNGEMKLQPLSREDGKLFELPQHVNDALKAFPDTDLLHDPEIDCYAILQANRHRISTVEWSNNTLSNMSRVCKEIPEQM